MQRPICSPETKDLVAAGFQKCLYPLWESAQEYLQCENAARKNIQVGFYIKIGGKKKNHLSYLSSWGLSPDEMKNKVVLSLAEIPSTGFIVELHESKFLQFQNQSVLDRSILDVAKPRNVLLPTTTTAIRSVWGAFLLY